MCTGVESNGLRATDQFALHLRSSSPLTEQLCKLKGREISRVLGRGLREVRTPEGTEGSGARCHSGAGSPAVVPMLETKNPSATPTESKSKAPWAARRTWGHSRSQHQGARGKRGKSVAQLGQIISDRARHMGLPETKPLHRIAAFGRGDCPLWSVTVGRHISSGRFPNPAGGCGAREPERGGTGGAGAACGAGREHVGPAAPYKRDGFLCFGLATVLQSLGERQPACVAVF